MIARSAVTLALGNALILSALRDRRDYDGRDLTRRAREELLTLIEEEEREARHLASARESARFQDGWAEHTHDYRRRDVRALAAREKVARRVAEALREMLDDDAAIASLTAAARRRALDDLASAIADRFGWAPHPGSDSDYERGKAERLRDLIDVDLARLVAPLDGG